MARLGRYEAFVEIIERGSLSAAARRLDKSLQSVSRALATLEDELGVELIRRTTRRMHPTPAGFALYKRLKAALTEIDSAKVDAKRETATVSGLFRVGASVQFAPKFVVPSAVAFMRKFPEVQIDISLDDTIVDLIECRLDVAVRIGDLGASSLRSKKVGELRRVVVAAPEYLATHGTPQTPAELSLIHI